MRKYYYFRTDIEHWLQETYDMQGNVHWKQTANIKMAYRTDDLGLYRKLLKEQMKEYFYWVETRDQYQNKV
ncbi:hypothetical protein [Weissella jogaejeotgali]|nr:hypothetical protein [Weissella jogaejeotgali]